MWLGAMAVMLLGLPASPVRSQEQDSTTAAYEGTLLMLRDSTVRVRSALQQFQRDLQLAGAHTVINRAGRLNEACRALRRSLEAATPVLRPARAPHEGARAASRELVAEMQALATALDTHCLDGLRDSGPGIWADSLKAWGPFHTTNLQRKLAAYDGAAAVFARAVGIRLSPLQPRGSP